MSDKWEKKPKGKYRSHKKAKHLIEPDEVDKYLHTQHNDGSNAPVNKISYGAPVKTSKK